MCSHKTVSTCRRAALLLTLSLPGLCGLSCAPKPAAPTSQTLRSAAAPLHPTLPRIAAKPKPLLPIAFPDLQTNMISSLVFSPDGRHLAFGYGTDAGVSLWNLDTGRLGWQRHVNASDGGPIRFTPSGRFMISQFFDPDSDTPIIVSTVEGRFVAKAVEREAPMDFPASVRLTRSGRIIRRSATKKPAKLWRPRSALYAYTSITADGEYMAVASDAKRVEVWNMHTRKLMWSKIFPDDTPRASAISPDGQTVAAATLDGMVYLWNLHTGNLLAKTHCADDVLRCLTFSPNGRILAAAGGSRGYGFSGAPVGVRLLDMATYKMFAVLKASLADTPDGKTKDWSLNHPDWFASLPDLSYIASPGVVKKIRMPGRVRDAQTVAAFSRPARVRAALRKCWQRG